MSPHGVFQLPKSACEFIGRRGERLQQLLGGRACDRVVRRRRLRPRPPPASRRRISSPQKTASEVGTEIHRPAEIPLAQQVDLLGEFRLQRDSASGAWSQALISAGSGFSNHVR